MNKRTIVYTLRFCSTSYFSTSYSWLRNQGKVTGDLTMNTDYVSDG